MASVHATIRRVAALVLFVGPFPACVAFRQHVSGPALWPVVFSAAADGAGGDDDPVVARAEGTTVVVVAVHVGPDPFAPSIEPMAGGALWLTGPDGAPIALSDLGLGLYGYATDGALYESGAAYTIVGEVEDHAVQIAAVAADGLRVVGPSTDVAPGAGVDIVLPTGAEDAFDQLLVAVTDTDGQVTYTNTPADAAAWLDFVSGRSVPAVVALPPSAFPERGAAYAVQLVGLRRARTLVERSANLRSEFSGFTTGAGVVVPVWTEP